MTDIILSSSVPARTSDGKLVRSSEKERTNILARMFTLWPHVEMSQPALREYVRMTAHMDAQQLQAAVDAAVREAEYLPSISVLLAKHDEAMSRARHLPTVEPFEDAPPVQRTRAPKLHETKEEHDRRVSGMDWTKYLDDDGVAFFVEQFGYDPRGCGKCAWGIVVEPDMDSINAPLWMARAIAAALGEVVYCTCGAGESARRSVGKTLEHIPAHWFDGRPKGALLDKAPKGGYRWTTGECPKGYIPETVVQAVKSVIEQPPTFHGGNA